MKFDNQYLTYEEYKELGRNFKRNALQSIGTKSKTNNQ